MTTSIVLPMVLRPGLGRKIVSILGALFLLAMGALIIAAGLDKPLVALPVGGLFCALGVVALLGVSKSRLTLDASGFTIHGFLGSRGYRWRDVEGAFRPLRAPTGQGFAVKVVVWNLVPGTQKKSTWRKVNRALGAEESLPAMFGGLNVEELAELLNQVRDDQKAAA